MTEVKIHQNTGSMKAAVFLTPEPRNMLSNMKRMFYGNIKKKNLCVLWEHTKFLKTSGEKKTGDVRHHDFHKFTILNT